MRTASGRRRPLEAASCADVSASAGWLEIVVDDVPADLASKARALQVGVAEMEADEHAGPVDVLDDVVEAVVGARRLRQARRPAVEREGDLVGAEEGIQSLDDRGAVTGMSRGVLGEVRRRAERLPGRVGN